MPAIYPRDGYAVPLGLGGGGCLGTRASPFAKICHPVGVGAMSSRWSRTSSFAKICHPFGVCAMPSRWDSIVMGDYSRTSSFARIFHPFGIYRTLSLQTTVWITTLPNPNGVTYLSEGRSPGPSRRPGEES